MRIKASIEPARGIGLFDNAILMESFFGSLKTELEAPYPLFYPARGQGCGYSSTSRSSITNDFRHSSIGYRTPAQARRDMTIAQAAYGEEPPGPDFGSTSEIVNGIFYVDLRAGCPWQLAAKRICHRGARSIAGSPSSDRTIGQPCEDQSLSGHGRLASGSDARPARAARLSTSQSVKTTEAGGPRGYDAGKKIKGLSSGSRRWSTPTGAASCSRRIRRVSRTAMVAGQNR